ncbi:MAG TPA: periplasmic heavy metal sensor [Haliangiales bacterium]|nr:periplasmic heavy metal sensor [Haliangiales bacterium]
MRLMFVAFLLLACLARTGRAEPPPPDVIGSRLFPPELIMGHQKEIGLDDKQRQAIVAEVQKLQGQVVELQWKMQAAVEDLVKLLDEARVDETKTLAQADHVMNLERDIKRAHLGMLIRIRNVLTPDQRTKLAALRGK